VQIFNPLRQGLSCLFFSRGEEFLSGEDEVVVRCYLTSIQKICNTKFSVFGKKYVTAKKK